MKYIDIQNMVDAGIIALSSQTLDDNEVLQLIKFKKKVKNLLEELQDKGRDIMAELSIKDEVAHNNRLDLLRNLKRQLTDDEKVELDELIQKANKFNSVYHAQLQEPVSLKDCCKPLSFEAWRKLKAENADIRVGKLQTLSLYEIDLEGILWETPIM